MVNGQRNLCANNVVRHGLHMLIIMFSRMPLPGAPESWKQSRGDKMMQGYWKNKKNGKTYLVTGLRKDATNGREDRVLVDYEDSEDRYGRDLIEFMQKFTLVESFPEVLPAHRDALLLLNRGKYGRTDQT